MREIKFRAWDKKEQCWVSGFSIHNSELFSDMIKGEIDKSGVCIANCNWQKLNELPHIKVMQYTGLKDKNGTEIYEGDIIEEYDDGIYHWVAKWDNECACFYLHEQDIGETFYLDDLVSVISKGKVIGNIHEHPHLLKIEN